MPSPAVVSALGHQQRPASLAQQGWAHWRREEPQLFCPAEVPDADVAACQRSATLLRSAAAKRPFGGGS